MYNMKMLVLLCYLDSFWKVYVFVQDGELTITVNQHNLMNPDKLKRFYRILSIKFSLIILLIHVIVIEGMGIKDVPSAFTWHHWKWNLHAHLLKNYNSIKKMIRDRFVYKILIYILRVHISGNIHFRVTA